MDQNYYEIFTEAVAYGVRDIRISPLGGLSGWGNLRAETVKKLLDKVPEARKPILKAIDKLIKGYGRYAFSEILNGKKPDHVWSKQALAYSLLHYEFSEVELGHFKFDPEQTFGSFITDNKPWELPEKILEYISTKRPVNNVSTSEDDWGDCCCC